MTAIPLWFSVLASEITPGIMFAGRIHIANHDQVCPSLKAKYMTAIANNPIAKLATSAAPYRCWPSLPPASGTTGTASRAC